MLGLLLQSAYFYISPYEETHVPQGEVEKTVRACNTKKDESRGKSDWWKRYLCLMRKAHFQSVPWWWLKIRWAEILKKLRLKNNFFHWDSRCGLRKKKGRKVSLASFVGLEVEKSYLRSLKLCFMSGYLELNWIGLMANSSQLSSE